MRRIGGSVFPPILLFPHPSCAGGSLGRSTLCLPLSSALPIDGEAVGVVTLLADYLRENATAGVDEPVTNLPEKTVSVFHRQSIDTFEPMPILAWPLEVDQFISRTTEFWCLAAIVDLSDNRAITGQIHIPSLKMLLKM